MRIILIGNRLQQLPLRRGAASIVAVGLGVQFGSAAAADSPDCSSGGRRGLFEVNVAALTDDGRLLCFKRRRASSAREIGQISGLNGVDTRLVGIDYRVKDGLLYGVGNGGGVYRIDTDTAVAEFVNSLSVSLTGATFGVDFNPAAIACASSAGGGERGMRASISTRS